MNQLMFSSLIRQVFWTHPGVIIWSKTVVFIKGFKRYRIVHITRQVTEKQQAFLFVKSGDLHWRLPLPL